MQQRITAVTLSVPDVAASVDFYRRAFGWEPGFVAEDEVAFYDMGGLVFGLWSGMSEELGRDTDPPPGAVSLAHNCESPEAVDEAIEMAVAAGATLVMPARHQPWGGYSGHIADPDGHHWEFAYNPDWPLDEEGRPQVQWPD